MISADSPLRSPPESFSRRQILTLDGLRYAAQMCAIAYERLWETLCTVSVGEEDREYLHETASVMLDAWSIVDSANRFRDLINGLQGLPNSTWTKQLRNLTQDVDDLRNRVQHQEDEIKQLVKGGGPLWGFISWAEIRAGKYTGRWMMLSAGMMFVGDRQLFVGPASLPFKTPPGRVRLNAFGHQLYLGRTVNAIATAVRNLSRDIETGAMRGVGEPAVERRGADHAYAGMIQVLMSNVPLGTV